MPPAGAGVAVAGAAAASAGTGAAAAGTITAATLATQAAIGFGLSALSFGIQYALSDKGTFGSGEQNFQANGSSTETYLPTIYGKAEIGMNRIFLDTDPKNKDWLYFVGVFAHGIIDGVTKIKADGDTIATYNKSSKKWEVDEDYTGLVGTIQIRRGSDNSSHYSFIGDKFKEWSDDRRARGCASIAMAVKYDQDKFRGGIPRITVVVKGNRLYDPRVPNDAKAYSNNLALVSLDYLRGKRYGIRALDEEIDFDSFIAEANHSDETVEGDPLEAPVKCKPRIRKMDCKLEYGATYYYKISYLSAYSENSTYDQDQTAVSAAGSVTITNKKGRVTVAIATPTDTNKEYIDKINVWRTDSAGTDYYLAREFDYNSEDENELSFVDNMSDEDLVKQPARPGTLAWDTSPVVSTPPSAPTPTFTAYTGNLTVGKYYRYKIIFGNANGHTQGGGRSKAIKAVKGKKIGRLFDIPTSDDKSITWHAVYRTPGMDNPDDDVDNPAIYPYKYLYTFDDNETEEYIDVTADTSLGSGGGADGRPKGATLTPDTCPETATITSGQQARYIFDGIIDNSKVVITNAEDILFCGLARLFLEGGKWRIHIKKPTVAETFALNEDNIIGDWDFTLPGADMLCNYVRASYTNPRANEQTDYVTFPPKENLNQYLIDHNRFEITRDIEFRGVRDKRRATRLAMIYRNLVNQAIPVAVKVKESALKARIGSVVKTTHSTPGWSGKKFWIEGYGIAPDATIYATLTEYFDAAFDLQYLNADPPDDTDTNLPEANAAPDEVPAVTFADERYESNRRTIARIKCSFTNPTSPFWDYSEVYIQKNAEDWEYYTQIDKVDSGVFYVDNVQEDATYYFVFLSVSTLGVREEFNAASFDKDDAENHLTVWDHTVGNITAPPDVIPSSINISVTDNQVMAAWEYEIGDVPDFDYFEVYVCTDNTYGTYKKRFSTKATYAYFTMPEGTYFLLIQAVDTAANRSNTASPYENAPSFTIEGAPISGTWATIITTNFSAGSHDGTEEYNSGGVDRLRVKQNMLVNPSFSTNLTGWQAVVGTWARYTSYYASAPASLQGKASGTNMYIEARTSANPSMHIEQNKWYIFTAKVSTYSSNVRLSMALDTIVGEVHSNYAVNNNNWNEVSVISPTLASLETTPKVRLKRESENPGRDAYFDDCKFTRFHATYQSAIYPMFRKEITKVKFGKHL
ncbi:exported protein [Candidatus Kuenenia stuttgartiensis]|uniref:Exported protein n=1 Tax=Kuenenia stuttgartiensis TaxID=174633 RepID=A0A6G7GPG9_KUEST|nr:hypothetical protein [Candidatus Kuenenia stuttgartiensis]QII11254.1 exported protein [Candidatus Kuenenia stuttgartiensis]